MVKKDSKICTFILYVVGKQLLGQDTENHAHIITFQENQMLPMTRLLGTSITGK